MALTRGQNIAAGIGLTLAGVAGLAVAAWPEGSGQLARDVIERAHLPDENPGSTPEQTTAPTTAAEPEPVASDCIDINTVSLDARIGAVLLPMAEITELDQLRNTMLEYSVSNFTLTTEDSKLGDSATVGGQTLPMTGDNNVFITFKSDIYNRTQIKPTMFLDEEGGIVQRTQTISGINHLPSALQQSLMSPEQLKAMWLEHAQRLKAMGVDVNFGPVADIGAADSDITSLERSYGTNVVSHAGVVIDALHEAGMEATLKHFAYGTVTDNTHDSPGYTAPFTELTPELNALQQLITNHDPRNIMVSHATIPGLTGPVDSEEKGEHYPASLSVEAIDYIRNTLRFTGVIMTDAQNMEALRISLNPENPPDEISAQVTGTWQALAAGYDLSIITLAATGPVHQGVEAAINDGRLDVDRLNQAAAANFEVNKGYEICGYDF